MTVNEFIDIIRVRNNDPVRVVAADQLWKTDELVTYLQEAIFEFARITEYWLDRTTPSICEIAVVAAQNWVPISDKVIRVRAAKLDLSNFPMAVIDSRNEAILFPDFNSATNTGQPRKMMMGEEVDKAFFDRTPTDADTLRLAVVRYPLEDVAVDKELCVPRHYALKLIPGVRAAAYGKQDGDTFDVDKALKFKGEFDENLIKIRRELNKKRHHPRESRYRDMGV